MASRSPVFRVETYEITSTEFTGKTYRLFLRHSLSANYYPMIMWGVAANASYAASELMVRVTADPYGTGDLSVSEGNYLELTRSTASNPCAMKVVVVECLRDEGGAGFQLLDVQATSLAASSGTGTQTTTDTCGTAWTDPSRVVLFGGYRGGGLSGAASSSQVPTGGTRIYPSSTDTINIVRYAATSGALSASTCVTYCVQWGVEWQVQRVTVTGTNSGATLDDTGHYSTQALTYSVLRAKTWLWACGYTDAGTPGPSYLGQVAALGDGVAQNSSESTVAVGSMASVTTRSVEVYVLTHQQAVVEYDFRPTSDGSGASDITVADPQVAESYRTASGLYGASTRAERWALSMAGVTSTTAADLSEVQVHARPTASAVVTATPADTSPSLSWAGWVETVDFGGIETPAGKLPVFRVTTYRIPTATFTSTTYTLSLLRTLATDYFVIIQGTTAAASTQDVDNVNVRVTSDPAGTDDLEATGTNGLVLTRATATADWVGTITVVECLRSTDKHGFKLHAVKDVSLSATTADRQITETTLSGVAYTDLNRVQVLTGYRGAGTTTDGSGGTSGHSGAGAVYGRPFGSNGVRLHRRSSTTMTAVTACAYVIEWGSAWTLTRQAIEGLAGGADINATSEFTAPSLPGAVTAAKSALFASTVAAGAAATQSYVGMAVALGDGVTVGTSPSTAAVGVWSSTPEAYEALIEVLSHPDLAVDQVFQATSAGTTATLTVDAPVTSEHYGTYGGATYTCGRRMSLAHTACSLNADSIAAAVVQARHTGPTTQTWLRDRADSASIAGWFQTIDFGGIYADVEAIQVNSDPADLSVPVGYLIMQDPHWEGAANVVSATSEGGAVFGVVEPETTNTGLSYAYQEGTPSGTTALTLRAQGGAPLGGGGSGGYIYRLASETTAADWKAQSSWLVLNRYKPVTTTDKLYGHALVYSSVYQRVIVLWITSATQVSYAYQSAGASLSSWTTGTITVSDAYVADEVQGLGACELPDGTILLLVRTAPSSIDNFDAYITSDGGTTWSRCVRSLASREANAFFGGNITDLEVASSGDYVRAVGIDESGTIATVISGTLRSAVSPDRGRSWASLGSFTIPSHQTSGNVFHGTYPFGIVGLGDIAGTFILAQMKSAIAMNAITFRIASGSEAWTTYSNLELDVSGYGTNLIIKGLWWCRAPDSLFLYIWYEDDNGSDVICYRVSLDGVEDANNWVALGVITGFSGALLYGPYRPRATWAGSRMVWSAGIQDPDTAGGGDPLIAGHWVGETAGWDTSPLVPSFLTPSKAAWLSPVVEPDLIAYQYAACFGDPSTDANTPYVEQTITTGVVTWAVDKITYTGTAVTDYARHSLTEGAPSVAWGDGTPFLFQVRGAVTANRSTSAADTGFRVMAPTTTGVLTTGYDVTFRWYATKVVLYDNVATAELLNVSTTDLASESEVRLTVDGNQVYVKWRKSSSAPLGAWTEYGPYEMTSGSITGQLFRVGVIAAAGSAGTSTMTVNEWLIGNSTDLGQGDLTKPDDLFGAPMTTEPMLVAGGAHVGWAGGATSYGDTYSATLLYQYGSQNLGLDSPSYFWESSDLTSNSIVIQADADSGTGGRWQVEALVLVGTVDRTCTLEFSDSDAWTSPAVSVDLDATLWDDLTVIGVDGCLVQLEAASGEVFIPNRGELLGTYIRFTIAGTATGKTYAVRADQFSQDGWLAVDQGADLSTAGVTVGAKAVLFADRMIYLGSDRHQYRYMRLTFPDLSSVSGSLGTATGTHRLGGLVPGHYLELNRNTGPLEVSYDDEEAPLISSTRSRSGVEHLVKDGEPARTLTLTVSYADQDNPTGTRGDTGRAIRDLLRVAHAGYTRPVALVTDSTWRSRGTVVYGHLNRAGATLEQDVPYQAGDGSGRFPYTGRLVLKLDEVT